MKMGTPVLLLFLACGGSTAEAPKTQTTEAGRLYVAAVEEFVDTYCKCPDATCRTRWKVELTQGHHLMRDPLQGPELSKDQDAQVARAWQRFRTCDEIMERGQHRTQKAAPVKTDKTNQASQPVRG